MLHQGEGRALLPSDPARLHLPHPHDEWEGGEAWLASTYNRGLISNLPRMMW